MVAVFSLTPKLSSLPHGFRRPPAVLFLWLCGHPFALASSPSKFNQPSWGTRATLINVRLCIFEMKHYYFYFIWFSLDCSHLRTIRLLKHLNLRFLIALIMQGIVYLPLYLCRVFCNFVPLSDLSRIFCRWVIVNCLGTEWKMNANWNGCFGQTQYHWWRVRRAFFVVWHRALYGEVNFGDWKM